jgi:hypothetical protein
MAILYDVAAHPLLSDDAKALEPEALAAQNDVAEDVLKLKGTSPAPYTDPEAVRAVKNAVAWQVNYQVAMGTDAYTLQSKTEGSRSETFRGTAPDAYPPSVRIVNALAESQGSTSAPTRRGAGWTTVRSLR